MMLPERSPMKDKQRLLEQANNLLKQNGFGWNGQPKKDQNWAQAQFERRQLRCGFAGHSRRRVR